MADFLLDYCEYIVWGLCAIDLLITIATFLKIFKTGKFVTFISFLVALGVTYNVAMIGATRFVDVLPVINIVHSYRYVVFGTVVPLLVLLGFYAMEPNAGGKAVAWVISLLVIGAGAAAGWFTEVHARALAGGLIRYLATSSSPAWCAIVLRVVPIVSTVFLLLAGIAVASTRKNIALIVAAVLGFLPHYLTLFLPRLSDYGFIFGAVGEMLLILFIKIYNNSIKK